MKMETVLVKVYDSSGYKISFPGVKMKNYILSAASMLLVKDYDSDTSVDNLRSKFTFRMMASCSSEESKSNFRDITIQCIASYSYDVIESSLDEDLNDIYFDREPKSHDVSNRVFGTFLLFSSAITDYNVVEAVNGFFDNLLPLNHKMIGSPVVVVSTPFQNLFLFNTHSRGIICNVLGRNGCFFFTDVKLSPGGEGAPVFSIYGDLIGTVVFVFTWTKGEWMGFTLAVHLYPMMKSWLNTLEKNSVALVKENRLSHRYCFIENINSYGVVLISSAGVWGSGVVFDKASGLIVTCSHVVSWSQSTKISVEYKRKKYKAEVVYATSKTSPFDVAVVRTSPSNFKDVVEFKFPTSVAKGEPVYMIGYPLFSFKNPTIHGPTVTYGHISNIFDDAMIVASCASNSGSSGGALVKRNGELVGLVSSNMMVEDSLVPHLTVVVPFSVFVEPIRKFIKTKNIDVLKCLQNTDEDVMRIWRLETKCKL